MLAEIGSKDKVPAFVKQVKESGGEVKLMGFGHRVYKNYDPRAKVIKQMADKVFEVTGRNPLLDIPRARADGAQRRLLRQAQAVPERRPLLRTHLPGDGLYPARASAHTCR
jgi:citrate synthase